MFVEVTLLSAFLGGLMGGVHCVGMCGGIVTALTINLAPDQRNTLTRSMPFLLAYNGGRLTSYAMAGLLMGGVGLAAANFGAVHEVKLVLQMIAGLFMLLLGFYLAGWWMVLRRLEHLGGYAWRLLEPLGKRFMPVRNPAQAFMLGLVWGWLPCGLVYTALIWSVTAATPLQGAGLMLAFGLGTLPVMLLMGSAASRLTTLLQKPPVRAIAGALVALFGLYQLYLAIQAMTAVSG